jgi:beta-barrel assembly-enhancing protease
MLRRKPLVALGLVLVTATAWADRKPGTPLAPGFNLFSKQQDLQLGQQAASQVREQYQVVQNQELQDYLKRLGEKLAAIPEVRQSGFQFTFTVLNSDEVNAFALPGGPAFVFTGLIKTAENEGELAGVLSHEMSHVILRHGTNQASKANLMQIPAALAGAALGNSGMGQLIGAGLGLGMNGLFLRFSRTDESQADAMGTHIMSEAGYNPLELANFFEKLEAKGGQGVPQFLSDHPNPGNRVKAVEAEIQTLPQRQYNGDSGQFAHMKQLVAQLPPPPPQKRGPQQQAATSDGAASGFQTFEGQNYAVDYPADWKVYGDKTSSAITIAPQQGIVQGRNGGTSVGLGVMLSYFFPEQNGQNLKSATADLIHHLHSDNPAMQETGNARRVRVGSSPGLVTQLMSQSPFGGSETDMLVTVSRPEGLFYTVFVAPQQSWAQAQPMFDRVLSSLRFTR